MRNERIRHARGRRQNEGNKGNSGDLKNRLEAAALFASDGDAPNDDLFDGIARAFAAKIREQGLKDNTQMRRWFNAVDELNSKAMQGILTDNHIRAEMALLRARIAFAQKRPGVKVPQALVDFITVASKKVGNPQELRVFRCMFECVVAYHRAGVSMEANE